MKRPEKSNRCRCGGKDRGCERNRTIDEFEAFLPSFEEMIEIFYQFSNTTEGLKAISKRLGGINEN